MRNFSRAAVVKNRRPFPRKESVPRRGGERRRWDYRGDKNRILGLVRKTILRLLLDSLVESLSLSLSLSRVPTDNSLKPGSSYVLQKF